MRQAEELNPFSLCSVLSALSLSRSLCFRTPKYPGIKFAVCFVVIRWSLVIYRSVNPMLVFQHAIVLRKSDRLLHILSATASTATALEGCGHRNRAWISDRLKRSCSTDAFIVANDEKYGHKQIISITPQLYEYILTNVREPKVSPDQAQLLAMLVQILGAERCIELGVYTGYSSLFSCL